MQEIVTFLKSLLSRKFLIAAAVFISTNLTKLPPKWQAIANMVVAGLYFFANVAEKKTVGSLPPPPIDSDAVAAQAEAIAAGTTTEPPLPGDTTAPDAGAQ